MTPEKYQEVFDKVWNALVEQGQPSIIATGTSPNDSILCAYRGADGCKCAVGHLIPDDVYDPSMEGENVINLKVGDLFHGYDMDFLRDMQMAHDRSPTLTGFVEGFKRKMTFVAKEYGVKVPEEVA